MTERQQPKRGGGGEAPSRCAPASRAVEQLVANIRACRICRDAPRGQPLPHEPNPVLRISATASICIAGQAPGTRVHKSGLPFTDPSGDRLRAWLGLSEAQFYDERHVAIVPMGFCFPGLDAKGGDLPPRKECAARWRDTVFSHLPNLALILLVGQYAQKWHLGQSARGSLTKTVADWRRALAADERPLKIAIPHPSWRNNAWLKRNPWFERDLLPRIRALVAAHTQ